MEGFDDARLREQLDELTRPAVASVRQRRVRRSRRDAWPRAIELLAVAPMLYLALCVVLRGMGVAFAMPWWAVLLAALAVPIVHLGMVGDQASGEPVDDLSALAAVDDELGLADRLSAAREYLDVAEKTPFMRAAIEDARSHVQRLPAFEPNTRVEGGTRVGWARVAWPLAGVAAFFLAALIEVSPSTGSSSLLEDDRKDAVAQRVDENSRLDDEGSGAETKKPRQERKQDGQQQSDEAKQRGDASLDSKLTKKSRGDVGRGKSSSAQSTSGRSTGEGQSTDQAQPTKGGKKKPKKPKKQKPPKDDKAKKRSATPKLDKDSMASSGQGRGRGSSKSPTASDWSSKDQSVADDDEELEDEDDVDDEDEESDARGGVQPNLRQRKPPVNRDLVLGFGGGPPPPHANGRGGPGLPKKQRGVAQLVLGIPYPDQITGKPNPGRTKVTQERIEPQAQQVDPVLSEGRAPRAQPIGHLSKPRLLPWMQDLIRKFQATLRSAKSNVRPHDER